MARDLQKTPHMRTDHLGRHTSPEDDVDVNATGARQGLPSRSPGEPGREELEREAARRRAHRSAENRRRNASAEPDPETGVIAPELAHQAFTTFADSVRDFAIFLMDSDGIITFWGEGARLIKRWTREEAQGGHLRMLYPDGGSEDGTAEDHLLQAAERGEYTGEGQRIRGDGSTFWAGVSLTALRDPGGGLLGFAKVTRDLTARRAAEAVLQAAREEADAARMEAEEANRSKSLFLATMSHEIRTPINAIMGYVDLLDLEIAGSLTPQQREQLARIRLSNMHLLGVIDEILDFSRLEAGQIRVARRAERLAGPVHAAIQMVRMQAEAKGVTVEDAVSGYTGDVPFWGDEDRVRQVLLVLLSNAVKFTPSGGRVTVSAGSADQPPPDARLAGDGPWVYAQVEDTGPGIHPARIVAIFEPFEQADMSLTRQHGGTGLGLTIAKRLATLMGGDVTVRSEPGKGSAFLLWLPAASEKALVSRLSRREQMDPPGPMLLEQIRDAIIVELDRVLHAYVARLRSDPDVPSAHELSERELQDHLDTFLSEMAETFNSLDLSMGADSPALRDGTAIQRVVAERHGRQRYRLGWSESEIRREFQVLREEVEAAIERRVQTQSSQELADAMEAVALFITSAERVSVQSFLSGLE
jgi:PAS domain S-box-containing protein